MQIALLTRTALPLGPLPYGADGKIAHRTGLIPTMTWVPSSRPRVLCFSRDCMLGETRRDVLQRRYDAVFVGSPEELAALATGAPFDVIVLCHTLSVEDRAACFELAQSVWPFARFVSVTAREGDSQPPFQKTVLGFQGPVALLNSVQQLLEPTQPGISLS